MPVGNGTDRRGRSLSVGVTAGNELTADDALCDTGMLRTAIECLPVQPGDVVTYPAMDGWRRIHVADLPLDPTLHDLRAAAAKVGRIAEGSLVDTLHRARVRCTSADDVTEALVTGYRLGRGGPADGFELSIRSSAAETIASAVLGARELVNRPPNRKAPGTVADEVAETLDAAGVHVSVLDAAALERRGCGGILAVGSGSSRSPVMVAARSEPVGHRGRLTFVGKGIVFDSGGLSLKPARAMYRMKDDVAGAAAVVWATWAIVRLGLPVAVRCLVPLAENVIGPAAMRPGDVVRIADGTSVEITSTDAEGRLVLADALAIAATERSDLVVDVASLTDAAEVALGANFAAVFGSDDDAVGRVLAAGARAGEGLWRLPLDPCVAASLTSTVADTRSYLFDTPGDALTAAGFLSRFASDRPWVHVDQGGTIWRDRPDGIQGVGATGAGVMTLVELARSFATDDVKPSLHRRGVPTP